MMEADSPKFTFVYPDKTLLECANQHPALKGEGIITRTCSVDPMES